MRTKRIVLILTAVATVGLERTSYGDSGTALVARPASVGVVPIELPAGWQINATVVQAAGEPDWATAIDHTILDVFLDPEEILLAEAFPGGGSPAAVSFGPNASPAAMRMVIRSDHALQQRFLTAVHFVYRDFTSGQTYDSTPTFVLENTNEGTLVMQNGLVVAAHIGTSMPPGGSNDSLIMVLKNGDQAVQYDDDNGVGLTSWRHLFPTVDGISPCPPGGSCSVLVANVLGQKTITSPTKGTWSSNVAEGAAVRLFWDEDVHNGRDADHDGIGDALEQMLGTRWKGRFADGTDCPDRQPPEQVPGDTDDWNGCKDSDRDGILDVHELGGVPDDPAHESNPWNLLMFSAYGADPMAEDVFVETHWAPGCIGGPPEGCLPGPKQQNRFTRDQVVDLRDRWLPFRVHVDTGDPNCSPPDLCGRWGGASILPDGYAWQRVCDFFSPERVGYFHDMLSAHGNQTPTPSNCSWVTNSAVGNPAHEFGHQFGLQHYGGPGSLDTITGCKPHYVSIMNYAYAARPEMGGIVPGFSLGLNSAVFNAVALDESAVGGVSTAYPYMTLVDRVFGRKSDGSGRIDWNMDGHISTSGLVQGPLNYAVNERRCDRAPFAAREGQHVAPTASDPSLVIANNELWFVARNGSAGFCAARGTFDCAVRPGGSDNCDSWDTRWGITTDPIIPAPYAAAGAGDILAFVSDSADLLYVTQPPWQGQGESAAPRRVPDLVGNKVWGQPVATADPTTGIVSVYAAGGPVGATHHLLRWDYDPRIPGWNRLGEIQYYDNGSPIEILETIGPGLTRGYQQGGLVLAPDGSTLEQQAEFLYLLLAVPVPTTPPGGRRLTLIRQVTATWSTPPVQYWVEMPASVFADLAASLVASEVAASDGSVGLAFRPEPQPTDAGPGVFVSGRFYMTFLGLGDDKISGGNGAQDWEPWVSFTQGNVFWDGVTARPPEREMVMVPVNNFAHMWANFPRHGVNLAYSDGNVRGVAQLGGVSIFPNADGVVNSHQHDYNDQAQIRRSLKSSLSQGY